MNELSKDERYKGRNGPAFRREELGARRPEFLFVSGVEIGWRFPDKDVHGDLQTKVDRMLSRETKNGAASFTFNEQHENAIFLPS